MRLTNAEVVGIDDSATICGMAAEMGGWHEEWDKLKAEGDVRAMNNWIGNKLMLVVSELTEAQDELRSGRDRSEVYYADSGKPEGFPVELADAVIRLFDLWETVVEDHSLGHVMSEKIAYNSEQRGHMHGGKAF